MFVLCVCVHKLMCLCECVCVCVHKLMCLCARVHCVCVCVPFAGCCKTAGG